MAHASDAESHHYSADFMATCFAEEHRVHETGIGFDSRFADLRIQRQCSSLVTFVFFCLNRPHFSHLISLLLIYSSTASGTFQRAFDPALRGNRDRQPRCRGIGAVGHTGAGAPHEQRSSRLWFGPRGWTFSPNRGNPCSTHHSQHRVEIREAHRLRHRHGSFR